MQGFKIDNDLNAKSYQSRIPSRNVFKKFGEISEKDINLNEEQINQLLSERTSKFSAEKIMLMLDKEKLEALEEEFKEHPAGIELPNFV